MTKHLIQQQSPFSHFHNRKQISRWTDNLKGHFNDRIFD